MAWTPTWQAQKQGQKQGQTWQSSSWGNGLGGGSPVVLKPMFDKSKNASSPGEWESKFVGEDFFVDPEARYQGTVQDYWKWQGYGFVTPDAACPKVPKGRIYIHWGCIQTQDRFPFLIKDMQVEFSLHKKKEAPGKYMVQASNVTMPGGISVAVQDDQDAVTKTFVGGQHIRYTGTLKFYNSKDKFGYVTIDDGFNIDSATKEIRVEEAEVNCGGKRPTGWMENVVVEFGIYRNKKGQAMVYNMTLPGAIPLARETLEGRTSLGPAMYTGTIDYWNKQGWWGHVQPEALTRLPPQVRAKLVEAQAEAKKKNPSKDAQPVLYFRKQDCGKGFWPEESAKVIFMVYQDDKGFGAYEVKAAAEA